MTPADLAAINAHSDANTQKIVNHIDAQVSKIVHGGATQPGSPDASQDAALALLEQIKMAVTK